MEWKEHVRSTIFHHLTPLERNCLEQSEQEILADYSVNFNRVFSTLGRNLIQSKDTLVSLEQSVDNPLIVERWSLLRLTRVWLLTLIQDQTDRYFSFIEKLFKYADMQELVALYSALNILEYPLIWIERCEEGVRSNIGLVQKAIIEQNKYPALYLEEGAWNQLVLKAFFTDRDVQKIYGLYERNNKNLINSIVDYIYERHSAKREIHPTLWLLAKDGLPARAVEISKQQHKVNPA